MQAYAAPWLQVNPLSYVDAAKAGADIGQRAAASKQAADTAAMETNSRASTAMAEIGAAREKAAAELALARENMGLRRDYEMGRLGQGDERISNLEKNRSAVNALTGERLGLQGDRNDIAQQNADNKGKGSALDQLITSVLNGDGGSAPAAPAAPGAAPAAPAADELPASALLPGMNSLSSPYFGGGGQAPSPAKKLVYDPATGQFK